MCFIQDMDEKNIPDLQLIKVREKLCGGKPSMCTDNRMSPFSSDRKAGCFQMSRAFSQCLLARAVLDGKVHIDIRDLHIAHDPLFIIIEHLLVCRRDHIFPVLQERVMEFILRKIFIIFLCPCFLF